MYYSSYWVYFKVSTVNYTTVSMWNIKSTTDRNSHLVTWGGFLNLNHYNIVQKGTLKAVIKCQTCTTTRELLIRKNNKLSKTKIIFQKNYVGQWSVDYNINSKLITLFEFDEWKLELIGTGLSAWTCTHWQAVKSLKHKLFNGLVDILYNGITSL